MGLRLGTGSRNPDDDDDGDGTPDSAQIDAVIGEDDLKPLIILLGPDASGSGTITLSCLSGCSQIQVYQTPDRSSLAVLPFVWGPVGQPFTLTLYVEGIDASVSAADVTIKAAFTGSNTCQDSARLTVYHVKEAAWETAEGSGNLALDDDTVNNGGRRIFPGKLSPTDATPEVRRDVDLVATVEPAVAGLEGRSVFFKVWDVDDPFNQNNPTMPNVSLIDDDFDGPDNRPTAEAPVSLTGTIDASGKARVTFTVSMQPGNNYRAGASVLQDALNQPPAGQTMQDVADAINNEQPATPGDFAGYDVPLVWSKMLTVWRKLWLEVDSMDRESEAFFDRFNLDGTFEQDRCVVASVTPDSPNAGFTTVQCGPDPDPFRAGFAGENFYEGGAFWCGDSGTETLVVRSLAGPESYSFVLWGNPGTGIVGQECNVRDDDPYFGAGAGQLPLTDVVDANIRAAYDLAYISVVEGDPSANLVNIVPWELHLGLLELLDNYTRVQGVSSQWGVC